MKRILLASASIAACMLGAGLSAGNALAETELKEIVVKTNFNTTNFVNPDIRVMDGQVLLTAPATVTVIDRERFNLDTVNYTNTRYELMTRVPGMSGSRNLRIPCGWCDYTVNLQNGVATQPLGGGSFNFDNANNFDIERIEIIKGPASALYPSHAFGGVINVITKKPPKRPTLRVFGDTGSWGRYRMGGDFGFSIENAHVLGHDIGLLGFKANASHYELDGWREWRGEKKDTGSFRVTWDPNDATSLEFGGTYTDRYDETPSSIDQEQWDTDWGAVSEYRWSKTKTANLDVQLSHKFDFGGKFELRYGYTHEDNHSHSRSWVCSYYPVKTCDFEEADSFGTEYTHEVKPRFTSNFDLMASELITGVDMTFGDRKGGGVSVWTGDPYSNDTKSTVVAPYAQYAFSPFAGHEKLDGLKFTLGGRYEYTKYDYTDFLAPENSGEKSFSKATPHTGVTYKWNENNSVWFSYSQGYSAPSPRRMWPSDDDVLDNPDLKPEEAENFEFGVRGSLFEQKFIYDVSWHHTTITNFILKERVDDVNELDQYVNVGELLSKGLEAQIGLWPVKWAGVEMAYTYAINKYVDYQSVSWDGTIDDYSGNYMRYSPKHHLNTRFILKPLEGTKVELEWDHISKYYTDSENTATYKRPDLFHLSASYTWNGMVTFWGQIRNLTDKKYADRVSGEAGDLEYRTGLPRSYAVGITIKAQF